MTPVMLLLIVVAVCAAAVTGAKHPLCYDSHPSLSGLLCYKACRSGYGQAGPVCWANCPPNTKDIGMLCVKHTKGRGVGKPIRHCRSGLEKSGLLCYNKCRSGYYGVGPVCWSRCKGGYADDGALCRRNVHIYGRDTGSCPWHDKCGLCGGPWYNVCGKRRNCGGSCKSGYHNDGCTCRKDVHIYAKKSYGRGVGKPLTCASNEDLNGGLCYARCQSGFYGVGPVCWAKCSGKTKDTGTQCQKNSYGRGVGKPVNCLKTPTCGQMNGGCQSITSALKGMTGVKVLQKAVCIQQYNRLLPFLKLIQTFGGCTKNNEWSTVSVSYSAGASVGVTATGEVGVAIDVKSKKGICFVGGCLGFKADVSIGAGVNIGYWKSIDSIPGKSKAFEFGLDLPMTEIGVSVTAVTSDPGGDYLGTVFSLGGGLGLNPIDVGVHKCDTPSSGVTHFTQP